MKFGQILIWTLIIREYCLGVGIRNAKFLAALVGKAHKYPNAVWLFHDKYSIAEKFHYVL